MGKRVFLINLLFFFSLLFAGLLKFFSFLIPSEKRILKFDINNLHEGVNEFPEESVIIIKSKLNFKILDATCTHLGCKVKYLPEKKIFQCPCHKSIFSLTGKVLKGPAKKNLKKLKFKIKKNKLEIFA